MRIVFRVDASLQIGSGHVMRCLTLADELRERGADILFICREHPGHLIGLIESKGFQVVRLPQAETEYSPAPGDAANSGLLGESWQRDAAGTIAGIGKMQPQWLIVDHYALDRSWEEALRPHVGRIMVIDDLADRPHDCNLLLDQNLYPAMETRYNSLVPESCRQLLGPQYALLRPEYAAAAKKRRLRDGQISRVLVFFGGVDPTNETEKTLRAVAGIADRNFEVDAVVGGGNPNKERIENLCAAEDGFHYHCQISNMAELMAAADLAVCAGGTATWERCFLELPAITVTNADNQVETTRAVAAAGAAMFLGCCREVSGEDIAAAIRILLKNPAQVMEMGKKSLAIMGNGQSQGSHALSDVIFGESHAEAC